jgi:hypothetical protein
MTKGVPGVASYQRLEAIGQSCRALGITANGQEPKELGYKGDVLNG